MKAVFASLFFAGYLTVFAFCLVELIRESRTFPQKFASVFACAVWPAVMLFAIASVIIERTKK